MPGSIGMFYRTNRKKHLSSTSAGGHMEEQLRHYMQVMRNFGNVYTRKVADGIGNIKSDLNVSQMRALFAFKDTDCLSMKELAANAGVKISNMTMMIDRLIAEGMAARDRDGSDRRKVMVRLTPEGEKIRSAFLAHRRKVARKAFSQLSGDDKKNLLNSLDTACKILAKIE
jgi:DNA-binding MarR family transcriptional regulator